MIPTTEVVNMQHSDWQLPWFLKALTITVSPPSQVHRMNAYYDTPVL